MSASQTTNRLFSQVKEGDELPPLVQGITATDVVLGALASRDWRPMHHDKDFAINRNGVKDIFINTPNFAAWMERYLTDWTGPKGRLGRMKFKMKKSVFPGDEMTVTGRVTNTATDEVGCHWVEVAITVSVAGVTTTEGQARVAVPGDEQDNPWQRKAERWKP